VKIIDKYLLKSFLITFTSVFVILFFIFVLQSIWLFIAELAGKDLDFITILKFILFYSPIMVPLVLPLSILLASIMTFGSMAENYEFAAMKSGGISLKRAMRVLVYCTLIMSLIGFLFSNNIIPEAQYRFVNLRKSILQTKPAMAIGEGQFNKIGTTFNIKVEKKSGENGEFLEGVTMHMKKNEFSPVTTVIRAKRGILKSDDHTNILQLDLIDGYYYEDIYSQKIEERNKMPFAKSSFKKYTINIDLAMLNGSNEDSGEVVNAHNMLNMSELKYTIDSLERNYKKDVLSYSENLDQKTKEANELFNTQSLLNVDQSSSKDFNKDLLDLFAPDKRAAIKEIAKSQASNAVFTMDGYVFDLEIKRNYINDYWISFYDKLIVAYSCMLMFFIGAPLGAIIRKGGVGLPIVFAVLIFITFNFANTFGKKLAGQDAIHPFIGVAAGALLLTPLAVFLTRRATNDQNVTINLDWLVDPIKNLFSKLNLNDLKTQYEKTSLDTMSINYDDPDYQDLLKRDTNILIEMVSKALQFGYPNLYRKKALKILESRGITQDELELENKLIDLDYLEMYYLTEEYKRTSKAALVFFVLTIVFASLVKLKILFGLFAAIFIVFTFLFIFKSTTYVTVIENKSTEKTLINKIILLVGAFPFYPIFYFYNQSKIKEVVAEYKK